MKIVKNVWKIGQNIPINIQDAVVLFMLSNLGAFIFEFTLDAVIIKSAVVFAHYDSNIVANFPFDAIIGKKV